MDTLRQSAQVARNGALFLPVAPQRIAPGSVMPEADITAAFLVTGFGQRDVRP